MLFQILFFFFSLKKMSISVKVYCETKDIVYGEFFNLFLQEKPEKDIIYDYGNSRQLFNCRL